jgi:F-type H+-transporting ATPase subunit a
MRGVASMLATLLAVAVPAGAVLASPAGGGHEAAAEAASGGGHHWSLADVLLPDSLKEKAFQTLGTSVIDKAPVTDLSHVVFAVVVFFILLVMAVLGSYRLKASRGEVLPERRFSPLAILQVLSDALLHLMEELLGREKALKFLPLIGSLGIFILFSNLMGLIPGFLPPTSNLNTTFALGSVVFIATHYFGVRAHGVSYFKHFFGPIFKWYALPLMILMFPIELISHIARPVSLAVRLFGNMFGDHAAISAFLAVGVVGWVLIPVLPLPLGTLVCIVQAMVFCILSIVYIYMATEDSEEGEGHH